MALNDLTVSKLKEIAKAHSIVVPDKAKKDDIIALIKNSGYQEQKKKESRSDAIPGNKISKFFKLRK